MLQAEILFEDGRKISFVGQAIWAFQVDKALYEIGVKFVRIARKDLALLRTKLST
jgi:hypothetical protein